jgi:putative tryptophan/tyrosine transport system substrate-binding protein
MPCRAIVLLVALALSLVVALHPMSAQSGTRVPRIGWLSSGPPLSDEQRQQSPGVRLFLQGLRELGWLEGQNLVIEWRYAEASDERLAALATELVQLKVDVIVAGDSRAIPAAQHATRTIPIVMTVSGDPIAQGYITSLARPGGNITGLANLTTQLVRKRLELLTEAVPGVSRVAVLGPTGHPDWSELAVAAQALGIQLHPLPVARPDEFEPAFAAALRAHANALLVLPDPITNYSTRHIVKLATQSRLPAMYALKGYVAAGGLMAYGPSIPALYGRAATYVDKILKGVKPGELPVEQPTTFELVINLKAAQALGLTIPPMLLFQADEVIR